MKRSLRRGIYVQALTIIAVLQSLLLQPAPLRAQTPATLTPTAPAITATPPAVSPPANAPVGAPIISAYTVGQCANADRDSLRSEIQDAALAVVGSSAGALDIDALVDRLWRDLKMDAVVDGEVTRAVAQVAADEGYWSRLISGWSADKAEEFARRIAQDAFNSDAFTAAIGTLSAAIGNEIARQVNAELAAAASTAFLCLRDYVGSAYSEALFSAFEATVQASVVNTETVIPGPGTVDINPVGTHGGLITGAGVIIVAQVSARVATRISEKLAERVAGRIVGRVLGRAGSSFVPVAGWVVGIALIVWDLVEGGKGALPQIEEALTDEDVKERIRSEVAAAVRAGLPEEAAITALETATGMIEEWDRFCAHYAGVCSLAAENASFRALLDNMSLGEIDHLQALEDVFLNNLGRSALDRALESGDFDTLLKLPPAAETILADTASVETTLAWADEAGPDLPLIASIGIHRFATPGEVSRDRLDKLLGWNDGVAVRRFLLLDAQVRELFWPLGGQTLLSLVTLLDEAQLTRLAQGLARWPAADHQRIAGDFLAGARTLVEVEAGPTPAPTFAPQSAGGAEGTGSAEGAATATPDDATSGPPGPPGPPPIGQADSLALGLLGALVVLLAVVAALLFWRRKR